LFIPYVASKDSIKVFCAYNPAKPLIIITNPAKKSDKFSKIFLSL